jgi:hypothetical protein
MQTAVGKSANFNLEEAIRDAVSKLPRVNPDITRHVTILYMSADVGGNMENGLTVVVGAL